MTRSSPITSWRSPLAWAVFLVFAVGALAIDLVSKSWAFRTLAPVPVVIERHEALAAPSLAVLIPRHEPTVVVPKVLELTLVLNKGAVFGMGAGRRSTLLVVTIAAIGFALWMFGRWTTPRDHALHAALGMLVAGGLGNLYDRLVFACVRDFLHPLPGLTLPFGWSWPWGGREVWPYVSNIADLFLIIGIGMLLISAWRAKPEPAAKRAAA